MIRPETIHEDQLNLLIFENVKVLELNVLNNYLFLLIYSELIHRNDVFVCVYLVVDLRGLLHSVTNFSAQAKW